MRVHEEEFLIFLTKLTYQSPRPRVAESQITSPADQSKPQPGAVAGPAGARPCLHRLPLPRRLTAPKSRASSVTPLTARPDDVTRRSSMFRPLGPLIGQLGPVIDGWAGEIS